MKCDNMLSICCEWNLFCATPVLIDLSGFNLLPRISRCGDTGFFTVGSFHSNVNLQYSRNLPSNVFHRLILYLIYFSPPSQVHRPFHNNLSIPPKRFFHPCGIFRVMTGDWRSLLSGWLPSICRPFFFLPCWYRHTILSFPLSPALHSAF